MVYVLFDSNLQKNDLNTVKVSKSYFVMLLDVPSGCILLDSTRGVLKYLITPMIHPLVKFPHLLMKYPQLLTSGVIVAIGRRRSFLQTIFKIHNHL